jgi:hypothetical protein
LVRLDLCASSEDIPEQDKAAELMPIIAQQLYVATVLGKMEQAEALAQQINLNEWVRKGSMVIYAYNV